MGIHKNKKVSKPKKKLVVKKKFEIIFSRTDGFVIDGRSPFNTGAKSISVNQDPLLGAVQDRRHILHYDEVLKPVLERVITGLYRELGYDKPKAVARVRLAMVRKGLKALPKNDDKLMERLVTVINSAPDNLIPDRADTNKAIEVVRGYLRKYQLALSTQEFGDDAMSANTSRMAAYKKLAVTHFPLDGSGSEISEERNRMHREILGFIDGCQSPCDLWELLGALINSVKFDFSPNITRDNTVKALAWQKTMSLNEAATPDKQLDDLLSLV